MQNKTFRLFISSTFNDLREERNILQSEVFPEIKTFCKSYGYNFEPIDLRWGVSNEAGLDHKAMEICINEVEKVFNYPRPNFLIMLGNRYGWIPVPTEIEKNNYDKLFNHLNNEEQLLLEKWFKMDENCDPIKYILQPIDKILGIDNENLWFNNDEKKLVNIITKYKNIFPDNLYIGKSATEQEIIRGVLKPAKKIQSKNNSVLCMVRNIVNINEIDDPIFLEDHKIKLDELKKNLKNCKEPFLEYKEIEARLIRKEEFLKPDKDYLENYAIAVKFFLKEKILIEIKRLEKDTNNLEDKTHETFMTERSKIFIGRKNILKKVDQYIFNTNKTPFIIYGESGVGKSAFMAKLIFSLKEKKLDEEIDLIYRFIGISEISSQPKLLLDNLVVEIAKKLGQSIQNSSKDYMESVNNFVSILNQYSSTNIKKLVIVIDALDQFETKTNLEWLESEIPKNIKIIVSTLPSEYGEYYNILKTKVRLENIYQIKKLNLNDGKSIIQSWLKTNNKKLTSNQLEHILKMFDKNGLPLYLKIIFDQALSWKSYEDSYKKLDDKTLSDAILSYFNNLIIKQHHPKMLVTHTIGYISASKYGLSENEIVEILSSDHIVMQDISNPYHKLPTTVGTDKLPSAVWSRLYYDLLKYLTFVEFDGESLISFYHRKIKESGRDYYYMINKEFYHTNLLEYFWNQPTKFKENNKVNFRKISELPYHCIQSNSYSKFLDLYNLEFIHLKVTNNQLESFLLECYEISKNISESKLIENYKELFLKSLAKNIIIYLLNDIKDPSSDLISVEHIHATLVYRADKHLYKQILELACNLDKLNELVKDESSLVVKQYFTAFSARYSNMIRREAKLEEAAIKYEYLESNNFIELLDYSEQSRVYYDIGYIAYLSGEFDKAISFMYKSAEIAAKDNSQVSRYISQCVGARIRMLVYGEDNNFEITLLEALKVFEENKFNNLGAKRWIKNVYAHLFEIGYEQKDIEKCEKYLDLLKSDDWMIDHQSIKKYSSFSPYEARVCILKNNFKDAVTLFEGFIYKIISDNERNTKESMARDYFDYLIALKEIDNVKFNSEYNKAVNLPDSPGNHIWKEKILVLKK